MTPLPDKGRGASSRAVIGVPACTAHQPSALMIKKPLLLCGKNILAEGREFTSFPVNFYASGGDICTTKKGGGVSMGLSSATGCDLSVRRMAT